MQIPPIGGPMNIPTPHMSNSAPIFRHESPTISMVISTSLQKRHHHKFLKKQQEKSDRV